MASLNKITIDLDRLKVLYVDERMSIPRLSSVLNASRSTIRARLQHIGVLRSRSEGIRIAAQEGRLGSGTRGKKREFSAEWKAKISESKRKVADETAAGISHKTGGYTQITRGPNKGRGLHVVLKEAEIGRRILPHEVVHHMDENKQNNLLDNLVLMTRSEHTRHHRQEQSSQRNFNGLR